MGLYACCRRVLIRVGIRRRGHPPQFVRFEADRWHRYRVICAAFQMQTQTLDSVAMAAANQPTLMLIRSNVEGVTYFKRSSGDEYVPRMLRPFEITDDVVWKSGDDPVITINNPTANDAEVDIFFATRDESGGGGGGLLF